jgi:hypothetical protein
MACAAAGLAAFALTGCGGGERQDAAEPSHTFTLDVVSASFPEKQAVAKQEEMSISVRNADQRTVPNLAVTVENFSSRESPDLADPNRPVWIVDHEPKGGVSTYTNTWTLGALRPGETRTFTWRVTAVEPGVHTVTYRVAAGLHGKSKAQLEGGREAEGSFTVDVDAKPAQARVDPETKEVIRSKGKSR